mmetsp:Transcript_49603/g.160359  ORF Transcript_49603/g.160359 Transcript_49603/m.160359 type:complete len:232 (-) Transcript_49603:33-728(-)
MSLSRDHQQAADPHEPQRHPLRAVALVEAAVPHDLLRHQALGKGADGLAILASLNMISVPQFLHVPNVLPIRGPHALIDFAVQGDVPVLFRGDVVHDPAALAQLPAIQSPFLPRAKGRARGGHRGRGVLRGLHVGAGAKSADGHPLRGIGQVCRLVAEPRDCAGRTNELLGVVRRIKGSAIRPTSLLHQVACRNRTLPWRPRGGAAEVHVHRGCPRRQSAWCGHGDQFRRV